MIPIFCQGQAGWFVRVASRSQGFKILKWLVKEAVETGRDSGWWQGPDDFQEIR